MLKSKKSGLISNILHKGISVYKLLFCIPKASITEFFQDVIYQFSIR